MNGLQNDNLSVNLFFVISEIITNMRKKKKKQQKKKLYKMRAGTTWKYFGFLQCSCKNTEGTSLARRTFSRDAGDHDK